MPFTVWPNNYTPEDCGAVFTWDSTAIAGATSCGTA